MSRQLLDISDFDTFNKQPYDKGVLTLNLTSWDEFHSVVKKFNNYPDYIWRGQKYAKPMNTPRGKPRGIFDKFVFDTRRKRRGIRP